MTAQIDECGRCEKTELAVARTLAQYKTRLQRAEDTLAVIERFLKPQFNPVPEDLPENARECFAAGRNWVVNNIREALRNERLL